MENNTEAKEIVGKINWTAYFPDSENIVLGKEDCKKLAKYIEYLENIEYDQIHNNEEHYFDEPFDEPFEEVEEDGDNNG